MQTQALPTTSDNAQVLIAAERDIELRSTKDGYDRYIKAQQSNVDNLGGHAGAEAVKMIRGSTPTTPTLAGVSATRPSPP
jgi:hypothetical protein